MPKNMLVRNHYNFSVGGKVGLHIFQLPAKVNIGFAGIGFNVYRLHNNFPVGLFNGCFFFGSFIHYFCLMIDGFLVDSAKNGHYKFFA